MGKYFVALFLQAVILILGFHSGQSIKCYTCNSNLNKKCGDPADKSGMQAQECSPFNFQQGNQTNKGVLGKALSMDIPMGQVGQLPKFACQKIKVVVAKGENVIMRGCTVASSVTEEACSVGIERITGGHGKVEFCGTCEEDNCNGSSRKSYTALLLMLVPCFAAIVTRWISI